jgi:hypothetical protein
MLQVCHSGRGAAAHGRRGMLDGMFEGFTTFPDRAACLTI